MKKFIVVVFLFLFAACRHHPVSDSLIDPKNNSQGSSGMEDRNQIQEPIQLDDRDLNSGERSSSVLSPVFFQYDDSRIEEDQVPVLNTNADAMSKTDPADFTIEGHCDERGTEEYNLALGDRRAKAARDYLVSLGIDPKRIHTISYGESHPFETGHDESAWKLNRRAQFVTQ